MQRGSLSFHFQDEETKSDTWNNTLNDARVTQPESGRGWSRPQLGVGAERSAAGDQLWTGGVPGAQGGHQEPGDPNTRFAAGRGESTPFPPRTHTGAGPESGARRTLPQAAGAPPPDLHPRKVVSPALLPCEGSPGAFGLPPAPVARSVLRGGHGGSHLSPPAWDTRPSPRGRRHLPARPGWAGSRARGPARWAHVLAPARNPVPKPHPDRQQQQQQQPRRAGPRHPRRRCPPPAPVSTWAPAPAAPPGPNATATSQLHPASEFPVPRLPKHAHPAGRGVQEEVLAGSCSLQRGGAGRPVGVKLAPPKPSRSLSRL